MNHKSVTLLFSHDCQDDFTLWKPDASLPHLCGSLNLPRQISFINSVTKTQQDFVQLKAKCLSDLLIGY